MEQKTLAGVFSRMGGDELTVVLIVGTLVIVAGTVLLTWIVASAVQRHHGRVIASSVVSEMLERGMALQDIIAVLKAMGLEDPPDKLRLAHPLRKNHRETPE